jgi:hypothetical protein
MRGYVTGSLGSARVLRAGFGVSPKQSFSHKENRLVHRLPDSAPQSSRKRDAFASTRDACATQFR